jgi:thiol:disulfide interchange protein
VQKSAEVAAVLPRFEPVEWLYDGLSGKVIAWTMANGNTNHDPSVLAYVVSASGQVVATAPAATPYQASSFAKWLAEQAATFERDYPRTAIPFARAEVAETDGNAACAALGETRAASRPVLVYCARDPRTDDDKAAKKECADCRAFEKKTLNAKSAAEAAAETEGLLLLRFDLADPLHAKLAATLGVTKGPALLLFLPGAGKPEDLGGKLDGSALAFRLKKLPRAASPAGK